ncbi:ATP-dependent RNA helicase DDX54-like isoform X2 [Stegodyphus dumicola]|uniref:ATP-dependent RNA helicase DDX54-like isoform X1 n=1 Tax=Stegodyphus dumicola TaxID=202533 RepID=UPI0015ABC172|nr:ATP-dependent RNA helicase DDX54-like isoform X1 [Stegodyphus dumicola]XP_035215566.1 ATP-dependent RNA helicase DDX54-like isoform X2 [Stegodyphus dumicola]
MDDDDKIDISSIIPQQNAKPKKKSGGFQSMGLSYPVLRAVLKKGYKVPTPIQRKAIPVIMEGKNVVAMARTGSGKTAAFLIPMLERLKCRIPKAGARALIFSPTRELAMQTMKFTKELATNTDLKAILVLGGEKIENQFAAIHESPDIIIATPGRFLHVVIEMDLKLSSVEYVVFDEADRLFEMGFQEQLQEVLNRLRSVRQTLLFSATLPKVLVDFIKVGIEDPVLIRLDVDLQISDNLKSSFFLCRTDDKTAVLLYLLKNVVNLTKELTVVFVATKHHVEYLKDVLEKASIPCSYIYSSLDQMARNIHIAKFRAKKVGVLLVTDIAARGIDIPLLDNVINFNFPSKPKLYVHRVGRVARAGRSGKAFSLISSDEMPYLLDLHLFLGKPIKYAKLNMEDEDGICGAVPQNIIDDEADVLQIWHRASVELTNMLKVTKNAYQQYLKSRPAPSSESVKRMKEFPFASAEIHPIFKDDNEAERNKIIAEMKNYRPNTTIFELGPLAKTQANVVMRQKRKSHDVLLKPKIYSSAPLVESNEESKKQVFETEEENYLLSLSQKLDRKDKVKNAKKKIGNYRDTEHYLSYISSEHYKEKGLGLDNNFEHQAAGAVLDLTGDDELTLQKMKSTMRWDRKKKKFVRNDDQEHSKKMKTESGVWIPKSYKSDLYKNWQQKNKIKYQHDDDSDGESQFGKNRGMLKRTKGKQKGVKGKFNKPPKRELKTKEEILKARKKRERQLEHIKKKQKIKLNRAKKQKNK